jgi:Undecaprenyl-phosphate glucose phosphotransferase
MCDAFAINGSFVGTYLWRLRDIQESGLLLPSSLDIWISILLLNSIFGVAFGTNGLYNLQRGSSRVDEAYKVFTATSLATVLTVVANTLLPRFGYDGVPFMVPVLALIWVMAIISTITLRFIHRGFIYTLRSRGIDTRRVVIVGAREPGRAVWRTIRRAPELGYHVQGFLSDVHPVGSIVDDLVVLGRLHHLSRVVRITEADEVLVALSKRSQSELIEVVSLVEDQSIAIKVYPDTFQLITDNEISIGDLNGLPLMSVKNAALDSPINQMLKRGLDIVFATIMLIILSPILLLLAILVKLDSPGPVFFLQERVGLDSKPFYMIKFRTMRTDSESKGPGWTTPNDPRITRLGGFLRTYSLDELPQFINVLLGEMSVVGPRPEQPKWVERFRQEIPRYMRRHKEKSGITGWAQVNGLRGDTSIEERTRYDLYYIENWSLLFDIKIILRTAADDISGKQENAY